MRLAAAQVSAEHQGSIHTATLTMSSQEWREGSGVVLAQYLQSVTKPLALGAEIAYQRSPKIPGGEIAVVSAAARYNTDGILIFWYWFIVLYVYKLYFIGVFFFQILK